MNGKKTGFTLIEVLVGMTILVVVFGLTTVLHVRAARIRKVVVAHSEVQQTLSRMMDMVCFGERAGEGLVNSTGLTAISETSFTANLVDGSTLTVEITTDGDLLLGGLTMDPQDKITLTPDSIFSYYGMDADQDPITNSGDIEKITLVRVELWGHSNDTAMQESDPVPFVTAVRLKNHHGL